MMDEMIKKLVADKGADMAAGLVGKLGLPEETAKKFVPPAVTFLVGWIGKKLASGEDVESAEVPADEVGELAAEAGVSADVATKGLSALLPAVLGAAKEEAGGLGALGSLLGGDKDSGIGAAAGAIKGLFG